jgi:hypothetical protein
MNWPRDPVGNSPAIKWLKSLLAASRASEIRPGANYKVTRTPNGTFLDIRPGGSASGNYDLVICDPYTGEERVIRVSGVDVTDSV